MCGGGGGSRLDTEQGRTVLSWRLPRGPGVELFTLHWGDHSRQKTSAGSAGLRGGSEQELGGAGCPTCPPGVQGLEVHSGRWPHAMHRTDRHPRPLLPLSQHSLRICCVRRGTGGQRDTGPVSRGSQLTGQLDGEHKGEKAEEGGATVHPARPQLFLTLWPGAGAAGTAEPLTHGCRRAQKARLQCRCYCPPRGLRPTGPHPPLWVSPCFLFFVLTTSGITK